MFSQSFVEEDISCLHRTHKFCVGVRSLIPQDGCDLRSLRLEALELDGRCFSTSLEKERNYPEEYWRDLCVEADDRCVIGLFYGVEMVGLTMVFPWEEDPAGRTALFGRSFIKPSFRGKGFSSLLYASRRGWTIEQSRFDKAVVFHRQGNFISEKLNKRYGAEYWFTRKMEWADGRTANGLWYRVKLRS